MTKNKKDFAPTFGDLRENYGMGPCSDAPIGDGVPTSQSPTVAAKDLPDLTRPTKKP